MCEQSKTGTPYIILLTEAVTSLYCARRQNIRIKKRICAQFAGMGRIVLGSAPLLPKLYASIKRHNHYARVLTVVKTAFQPGSFPEGGMDQTQAWMPAFMVAYYAFPR
jgi:hypothetical protein